MKDSIVWKTEERDAIVIGASYAGMITAALLAQGGKRTLVIDPLDMVGQPGGAYPYGDYWINYGHRDGVGMRQTTYQGTKYNLEALERLGVTLPLVGPIDPGLLCHLPPSKDLATLYGSDPNTIRRLARDIMGLPEEDISAFVDTLASLARTPRAEAERLIPVTFAEWLPSSGLSLAAQRAVLAYCDVIWSVPAEITSVGRFIISHLQISGAHYHVSDPKAPGNQAMITPFAEKFQELGGEIWFDQKPLEILVEDGKVAGLRMRNRNSFVREVRAPVVVFAYVAHHLFDIIDESLFPPAYVEQARSTKKFETPLLVLWMGLSELPRRRSDGEADESRAFHRLLFPGREYGGGWKIVSNCQEGVAPPGKHLFAIYYGKGTPFAESTASLNRTIDYVWDYYANFDEIVEWHEYQWIAEAHSMGWAMKTGDRASQKSPIPGLYLTGYTTNVEGIDYDADACGALRAADFIFGRKSA